MLRVTIELLPHGYESAKRTLGIIEIANDGSGDKETGNYNVRLSKEMSYSRRFATWKKGRVEGFPRLKLNPYDLLFRALRACVGRRNKD